jgi:CBS domain-containing protein
VVGYVEPIDLAHTGAVADVTEATGPLLAWVDELDRLDGLAEYGARLARLAQCLVGAGIEASEVVRIVTAVNDVLTVRLLRLAETGLGPPPCPYAWLVLGSGGRREQALLSDQDNALVYRDATPEATAYFKVLAETTVGALTDAGFRRCPGGYMATSWRHTLADWQRIFHGWVQRPEPQALVEAEVFLDFRRVHGRLSPAPLDEILRDGSRHPRFLVHMAKAAVAFRPPLGLFGRIKVHHRDVDLKRAGIAAIVLLARLYALAAGSVVRPTLQRLAAAADGGTLSRGGARRLTQDYVFLTDLRLRTQLRRFELEGRPDNHVSLDELGPDEQQRLRAALRSIHHQQEATALRFRTDAVS